MKLSPKPSAKELDVISMLRKRVDPRGLRPERYRTEEGWMKNILYFSGQQSFYIENGRVWDATTDLPEHRVMYKVNLTRMAVIRAAAKVLNVNAKFRAVPQSGSARHRNIAETSEKLFDHLRDTTGWNDSISLLGTMWAAICGSAFYRVVWDPLAGEPDRFYQDPETKTVLPTSLLTPEQQHEFDRAGLFEDLAKGEVRIDVDSPFAIYHDWSSRDKSVKGCHFMASRSFVDRERIAERWNVNASDLMPEDTTQGLLNYEEAIAFMSSSMAMSPFAVSTPDDKRGDRCMLVDYWERPSREYKKGRRVVYAGQRVLYDGDNPYVGDRSALCHLPWVKQDWTPHPGRFWGSSLVEDLTSPQHAVNDSRMALLEFLRVFGRPATYIWSNSGLDPREMTIEPGGVYTISALSKPPVFSTPPNLPPDVTNIGELCAGDLNMVASQSEIDGAKIPGQMRSGEAIRMVNEQRDIALNVTTKCALVATRDVGRMGLKLAQMYYTEPRTLRYIGENSDWNFVDFTGADLTNDLIILGEPSMIDTVAGRRAELMDAIAVGAINPATNPEDRDYVLSALHYNDSDQTMRAKLKAQKNQEDEIRSMIADPLRYGDVGYPVMPWENHEQEIRVLVDFMYTAEFKRLPPQTQSIIAMHWQAHMTYLQMQLQQEQQALQAQKGAPGEKGEASQPKQGAKK